MARIELNVQGGADLTKLYSEAVAVLAGRAFERPGAAQRRSRDLRKRMLERLQEVPPSRRGSNRPFVWSANPAANARARRWFFAHYPDGYARTGQLEDAWTFAFEAGASGLVVRAANEAAAASYVYGDDGVAQVPGHADTGWYEAVDRFLEIAVEVERYVADEVDRILEAAL